MIGAEILAEAIVFIVKAFICIYGSVLLLGIICWILNKIEF